MLIILCRGNRYSLTIGGILIAKLIAKFSNSSIKARK